MAKWKLHIPTDDNRITDYKCGLKAGQVVALKKDLIIKDHRGKPTGEVHKKGEHWKVLTGITSDPVLWFSKSNGERCTWDDDIVSVTEWFEVVDKHGD